MNSQGPSGVSGPGQAPQGGTITVQVTTGDNSIQVSAGNPNETVTYPVAPDGTVTFPVPPVPPSTWVKVVVGKGNRKTGIVIEIIAPGP